MSVRQTTGRNAEETPLEGDHVHRAMGEPLRGEE